MRKLDYSLQDLYQVTGGYLNAVKLEAIAYTIQFLFRLFFNSGIKKNNNWSEMQPRVCTFKSKKLLKTGFSMLCFYIKKQ